MSSAKRRVQRKIRMLLRMDSQIHSYRTQHVAELEGIACTQGNLVASIKALGRKLVAMGFRPRSAAAIYTNRASPNFGKVHPRHYRINKQPKEPE